VGHRIPFARILSHIQETGTLFYLTTRITTLIRPFRVTAGGEELRWKSASCVVVQCASLNARFLLGVLKEGTGNAFVGLVDTRHM
jgi:hypothetical protein